MKEIWSKVKENARAFWDKWGDKIKLAWLEAIITSVAFLIIVTSTIAAATVTVWLFCWIFGVTLPIWAIGVVALVLLHQSKTVLFSN